MSRTWECFHIQPYGFNWGNNVLNNSYCFYMIFGNLGGAQLEFVSLAFSASEYLVSISGTPEHQLIIWWVLLLHSSII